MELTAATKTVSSKIFLCESGKCEYVEITGSIDENVGTTLFDLNQMYRTSKKLILTSKLCLMWLMWVPYISGSNNSKQTDQKQETV